MTMHDVEEAALGEVRARAADLRRLNLDVKNASERVASEKKQLEHVEAQQRSARHSLAKAVEKLVNIKPAPHDHSAFVSSDDRVWEEHVEAHRRLTGLDIHNYQP